MCCCSLLLLPSYHQRQEQSDLRECISSISNAFHRHILHILRPACWVVCPVIPPLFFLFFCLGKPSTSGKDLDLDLVSHLCSVCSKSRSALSLRSVEHADSLIEILLVSIGSPLPEVRNETEFIQSFRKIKTFLRILDLFYLLNIWNGQRTWKWPIRCKEHPVFFVWL